MITDLVPDDLTPAERLRGAVAMIRSQLASLKAQSGLVGVKAPDFQFLVAVHTEQGVGVLLALPGDDFLADIEAVINEPLPLSFSVTGQIDASLLAWGGEPDVPFAPTLAEGAE
jgi:hypothetical protein